MTPRIEKSVFISYRRANKPWALFIYQNLTNHGYDVFIDFQNINSGNFETAILDNIRARAHFVVVLTPSALEGCKNSGDWLRREIETALDEKRNIVPLLVEGFDFGSPLVKDILMGKLAALGGINGLRIPDDYPFEAMDRLRDRYLNVALSYVNLPTLQPKAKEIAFAERTAANEAPPVREEQLTSQTWFERGAVFHMVKNLEEARRCYIESIRLDPNLFAAYNNLGILHGELNRYNEAEAAYRKAIELDPSNTVPLSNLGSLLGGLKRYDEAAVEIRKAIELDLFYDQAYYNLGILMKDLNRNEEAEVAFRKAIELNPTYASAYSNLGSVLNGLNRYEEAEVAFRKVIELNPSDAIAYSNLGFLLKNLARYEEAERALRKAIKLDPSYAKSYSRLGDSLKHLKRYEESEAAYRNAIELHPDFVTTYYNRADLYEQLEKYPEAIADHQKYLELGGGVRHGDQKEVEDKIKKLKNRLMKKKTARKRKSK